MFLVDEYFDKNITIALLEILPVTGKIREPIKHAVSQGPTECRIRVNKASLLLISYKKILLILCASLSAHVGLYFCRKQQVLRKNQKKSNSQC
jgi:hypothetical protein